MYYVVYKAIKLNLKKYIFKMVICVTTVAESALNIYHVSIILVIANESRLHKQITIKDGLNKL